MMPIIRAKALSLHQPFASLIADGHKTIETRTWPCAHRGPLVICASKKVRGEGPTGVALAVCEMYDCRPFLETEVRDACCEHYRGYGFHLRHVRAIKPVPVVGRQGLFNVSIDVDYLDECGRFTGREMTQKRVGDRDHRCLFCNASGTIEDMITAAVLGRERDFFYKRCDDHARTPGALAIAASLLATLDESPTESEGEK